MEMMKMGLFGGVRTNQVSPGIQGLAGFEGEFEVREANGILIPILPEPTTANSLIRVARKEIIVPQFDRLRSMEQILRDNCVEMPRIMPATHREAALFI